MQPAGVFSPVPAPRLNRRQQAFARHYVRCGNGAEAARRAGYSVARAKQTASRLLATNGDLRAFIEELGRHAEVVGQLTPEHIAGMLLREAAGANHAGARVRAMELLGKWKGLFRDTVEIGAKVPVSTLLSVLAKTRPDLAAELAPLLGAENSAEPASAK